MSALKGQYTLYYSLPSPPSLADTGHERQFDNIVDSLSAAWLVLQEGGSPSHLIYNNAVLFSREDLKEVLENISGQGAQPGIPPTEIVRQMLPEVLIEELAKTVHLAHEHFGAVAVYRSLLEELYEAADQAIQKKDIGLLHTITGKLAFWYVPSEDDVRQWGKDFLHAYKRDARWLYHTKQALEKIKAAAEQFQVEAGSQNSELQRRIIEVAEDGLITHI